MLVIKIDKTTSDNNQLYVNNSIKKGYEAQSDYYRKQLDKLIQEQDNLKSILSDGEKLLIQASDILPGTSAATQHISSRR